MYSIFWEHNAQILDLKDLFDFLNISAYFRLDFVNFGHFSFFSTAFCSVAFSVSLITRYIRELDCSCSFSFCKGNFARNKSLWWQYDSFWHFFHKVSKSTPLFISSKLKHYLSSNDRTRNIERQYKTSL